MLERRLFFIALGVSSAILMMIYEDTREHADQRNRPKPVVAIPNHLVATPSR